MDQKQCFLNLLKNLVINFYWVCPIIKICISWRVPAQISYLEKFWFLRCGPKCSQPIRLQDFLIDHISRRHNWIFLPDYLLFDTSSLKLKADQKLFGLAWPEMGVASHATLTLTVSQEWIVGMNWFFACWCKFKKAIKVILMIFGWAWLKIGETT